MTPRAILTLACTDRPGIVGAVGTFLAEHGCNIVESAQFGDVDTGRFFMRVVFEPTGVAASARGPESEASGDRRRAPAIAGAPDAQIHPSRSRHDEGAGGVAAFAHDIAPAFAPVAARFAMDWRLHDARAKPPVLIMVSRLDHCLNDLLYRVKVGSLPMRPVAIVSNHPDCEPLAAAYGIPYHHLPVTPATKRAQEAALGALVESTGADLVVLARYMQILSDDLAAKLAGRAINIHHGLLPSFKGAKPYHQAYDRGVKLIGATAHYVTSDLDEGPIIDQEVARVDYDMRADDLVTLGRDVECQALARAVKWHLERRVFLNGAKTVVFR